MSDSSCWQTEIGPTPCRHAVSNFRSYNILAQAKWSKHLSIGIYKAIFEDLSYIWISHPIRGGLNVGLWANGHAHVSEGGVTVNGDCEIKYWFHGEPTAGNEGLMIDMYSYYNTVIVSVTTPFWSNTIDNSDGGMVSTTVAVDNTVYEELKNGCSITITGVD